MSRLHKTALAFDKTPCKDAYTGSFSFFGQLKAWAESTRDSEVAARRVLSCGPDVLIPARRVVDVSGEVYILGQSFLDNYGGRPIRKGFAIARSSGLAQVATLGQLCTGQPGTLVHASSAWFKDDAYSQQDSHINPKYNVYLSGSELVYEGQIITLNTQRMIVRASYLTPSLFLGVVADDMPQPNVVSGTLEAREFDPVTNMASGSSLNLTVVRIRWQSYFKYTTGHTPQFEAGDQQFAVAKSAATPKAGHVFAMSDGHWTVSSVGDGGDVWLCKVCRAG